MDATEVRHQAEMVAGNVQAPNETRWLSGQVMALAYAVEDLPKAVEQLSSD
jgi:hypothetical protein